jgi:hypothetical protein
MNEQTALFGSVRRWKEGDILWASNDWIGGAYVVTDDPREVGHMAWHGPKEICVEYITAEQGKLWDQAS